jgi:single-strand DNA-binding protein
MLNKTLLIGNVGADPVLRHTTSGRPVANFNIATTERWSDTNGNPVERTQWHRIVCWGKLADTVHEYLKKGRQVYVEGRLQTRQWEDRDGVTRVTPEIVAQLVRFLGAKPAAETEAPPPDAEVPVPTEEEAPAPQDETVPF